MPMALFAGIACPSLFSQSRAEEGPWQLEGGAGLGPEVHIVGTGWRDWHGNTFKDSPCYRPVVLTVVIRNFDRWIMDLAYGDPGMLAGFLTLDELRQIDDKGEKEIVSERKVDRVVRDRFNGFYRKCLGDLRLVLMGRVFQSVAPFDAQFGTRTDGKDTWSAAVFSVAVDDKEVAEWQALVRTVGSKFDGPISVALATGNGIRVMKTAVNTAGQRRYSFHLVPPLRTACAWATALGVLALILRVGATTETLRLGGGPKAPWSLARVALAWWLAIVCSSYLFLWAMTGHVDVLSGSAPVLLGIQGGTLLSAVWATQRTSPPDRRPSAGFLRDLVEEGKEAEVSRLQMLVWNGILGVVFLWQTVTEWKMPEFDATLMTLMGISSAAYVGFKFLPTREPGS